MKNNYNKIINIYLYYNYYTFFLLYLFNLDNSFIYIYNKFLFFNIYINKLIFFFEDFIVKAEVKCFILYRHYFEHFRRLKYNEYLSTNKILYKYPLLKKILHITTGKLRRDFIVDFRKNILFKQYSYNIYEFEETDATEDDFQYNILGNKKIYKNLQMLSFLKFFKIFSKNPYFIAVDNFKSLMGTYLLLKAYHLYYLYNRKRSY